MPSREPPSREPTADVLTEQEVGHFHAFGYVVLRAALSPQEVVELQAAYDRVVAGEAAEVRDTGTLNVDRPHEAEQAFLDLIGHPRLMAAMRQIDGTEFLFHSAQATHRREEVRWHCDFFPPHVTCKPMKVNVYLDSTHMDDGALELIPGSHLPELAATVFRHLGHYDPVGGGPRLRPDPSEIPGVAVETEPGDIVVFHNFMWHFAPLHRGGGTRRTIMLQYYRDPGADIVARKAIREIVAQIGERPGWGSFIFSEQTLADGSPALTRMAERYEEIGVTTARRSLATPAA
jgi:ectoine hydroxylase-related dioxygenase (phytanoyl-CoA dioxygenase family)